MESLVGLYVDIFESKYKPEWLDYLEVSILVKRIIVDFLQNTKNTICNLDFRLITQQLVLIVILLHDFISKN